MALLSRPEVDIRWRFSYATLQGVFNDALYFTPDEYQNLIVGDILAMQRDRRDAWLEALRQARINARAATRAELQAQRVQLQKQLDDLDAEILITP